VKLTFTGEYEYVMAGLNVIAAKQYREQLGSVQHDILIHDVMGSYDEDSLG
jgi:signal peptidase I